MGLSVFPAPSAGKTTYRLTLTTGTSWTVPAGVTYINATLVGGGGGGAGGMSNPWLYGADGTGGQVISNVLNTTPGASIAYAIGAGGGAGAYSAQGGLGGTTTMTGLTSALGGGGGAGTTSSNPSGGSNPGLSAANYGIGGKAANPSNGSDGGSGSIIIEYWV
jgi:hypothetical protein